MQADPQIIAKVMSDYDKREAAKSNQNAGCKLVTPVEEIEYLEHTAKRVYAKYSHDPRLYCHLGTAANAAAMAVDVAKGIEREKHGANAGTA